MNRKRSKSKVERTMPMVHPNAAAIDVGATMHMAAVRADRAPEPVRSFGTFTTDLRSVGPLVYGMRRRDRRHEIDQRLLDTDFRASRRTWVHCFLVNARDAKHVPGRKTDVSDAQWLQQLRLGGSLRASFQPKGQIAELRACRRQRERLLEYAASHIQHMQKAFDRDENLQLHHIVADIADWTVKRMI